MTINRRCYAVPSTWHFVELPRIIVDKSLLTSSPVECRHVDSCEPVDNLGQHEDDDDAQDSDGDEAEMYS